MTQEEKIKDLEERIAMMDADNSALCKDLEHWKKVAAGLKGHNRQLANRVEHFRQLDLEGDELYEKSIAEIDRLKSIIKEKDTTITGLESQINEMLKTMREQSNRIECLKSDVGVAEANLEYHKTLPWWKKIFKK
jgi:predicted RNase H-like nuclease (RuvC/YqgF family)